MRHDLRGYESEREALRANNLRPKLKRLIIVLTTVDTAEQGVGRAEGIEARGDDYANGAEVMRKMGGQGRLSLQFSSGHIIPISATKKKSRASGFFFLYFSLFSFHSSLFSNSPTRLFQRRDKREERKEKVAFLPLVEKH